MVVTKIRIESTADCWDYRVDDVADISSLPQQGSGQEGSTAFVINTGDVYMLGSEGWRVI